MAAVHKSRFLIAVMAMLSMLFTQLAVAGYVCPLLETMPVELVTPVAVADDASMLPCHDIDQEEPNLCSAHAQEGNQSLDKPDLPAVLQFVASSFAGIVMPPVEDQLSPLTPIADGRLLTHATAPPVSVQHCCFRI